MSSVLGPWVVVPLQAFVPPGLPGCMLYPLPGRRQLLAQVVPIEFGAGGAITAFTSSKRWSRRSRF